MSLCATPSSGSLTSSPSFYSSSPPMHPTQQLSSYIPESHRHERIALGIPAEDTSIMSYETMEAWMESRPGMRGWRDVVPVLGAVTMMGQNEDEDGEVQWRVLGARRKVRSW
ncbi:hypothetical protein ACMFMG_002218 [Clarireedia jacksonii]